MSQPDKSMAGTDQLPANQQFGVILERLKAQDADSARTRVQLDGLAKVLEEIRIEKATTHANLDNGIRNVAARIEREELARAEETRQRIAVNTEHNLLMREIDARANRALEEQKAKHEAEIAEIKKTLDVLPGILLTNRILIGLVSATVVSFIGALVTGHISFVINP